jgi:4'-phosphopantetheinyl transferase
MTNHDHSQTCQMLPSGTVQIWFTHLVLTEAEREAMSPMLSKDELHRMSTIQSADGRSRFAAARIFVRQVLGSYLGILAEEVQLSYETKGKPMLVQASDLKFNLSHARDLAAIAVTRSRRVGMDVEIMRENLDLLGIARHYFCPSEFSFVARSSGADRVGAFYTFWTSKEAYLKARGDGLFRALDSFQVSLESPHMTPRLALPDEETKENWSLKKLDLGTRIAAAVVAEGHDWEVRAGPWSLSNSGPMPFPGTKSP